MLMLRVILLRRVVAVRKVAVVGGRPLDEREPHLAAATIGKRSRVIDDNLIGDFDGLHEADLDHDVVW